MASPGPSFIGCTALQVTLSNGLRLFLIEDHEVPLIKGTIAIRGGQRASPADKVSGQAF